MGIALIVEMFRLALVVPPVSYRFAAVTYRR
jgi:hypothetical protein